MDQGPAAPALGAIVVMGPSGCGKSTVGAALAEALGCAFIEGDDLHSAEARAHMASGVALTDAERLPWLGRVAARAVEAVTEGGGVVVACSALKVAYRERLAGGIGHVRFVALQVAREVLAQRMRSRPHFMPVALLDSQLATLEPPGSDERVLTLDGAQPVAALVRQTRDWLDRPGA